MPLSDDEVVQLLGRLPPLNEAPEAARSEADVIVRRGQNTEKESDNAFAAVKCYLEALQLDASCKGAYEAIGRLVLAKKDLGRPAVEAAVRYFEVAQKRV